MFPLLSTQPYIDTNPNLSPICADCHHFPFRPPSPALFFLGLFSIRFCITNSRTYDLPLSVLLLTKSRIDINLNLSSITTACHHQLFRSSCPARLLLGIFNSRSTRTFSPPSSPQLLSQSYININPNPSPFSTDLHHFSFQLPCYAHSPRCLASPMQARLVLCLLFAIHARLVLLCLLLCSHNHALRSIFISLPFLQIPISTPFDPRVLLALSVSSPSGFVSPNHARLIFLCPFFCFHSHTLTSVLIPLPVL